MAKATGYFCDNCKTFDTTDDSQPPLGWLRLTVRTGQHDPNGGFDLCSNKCLAQFGRERQKAEKGETTTPSGSTGRRNPAAIAEAEGLTTVAGKLDEYLREYTPSTNQSWWSTYTEGYRQTMGTGYSWIVDFDDAERSAFAEFVERVGLAIRHRISNENRAQTSREKHLLAICANLTASLREAA